jgi:hypothetical protein
MQVMSIKVMNHILQSNWIVGQDYLPLLCQAVDKGTMQKN